MRWEPAIYEHKATLIGSDPFRVANQSDLLARACIAEQQRYHSDAVTVAIDVYNIEVQACGARVIDMGPGACPDIAGPIFDIENLPDVLPMPDCSKDGRFAPILQAARQVRDAVNARVRVPASGPVSIASRLVGLEDLVVALASESDEALWLLDHTTAIAEQWCAAIMQAGFEVVVFDSASAPPLLSPRMYQSIVAPLHARLMRVISPQRERPLIIGGDTRAIIPHLLATGANYLICDFGVDARSFADAIGDKAVVRRNADPKLILDGDLEAVARAMAEDLKHFARPVAGTGVLPCQLDPARLIQFRQQLAFHLHEEP
jgi:uroporphyrinogen-III decarboxylase